MGLRWLQAPKVMLRSSHCWERLSLHSLMVGTILSSSDGSSRHWLLLTCLRVSFCNREEWELQQDNYCWKTVIAFSVLFQPYSSHYTSHATSTHPWPSPVQLYKTRTTLWGAQLTCSCMARKPEERARLLNPATNKCNRKAQNKCKEVLFQSNGILD